MVDGPRRSHASRGKYAERTVQIFEIQRPLLKGGLNDQHTLNGIVDRTVRYRAQRSKIHPTKYIYTLHPPTSKPEERREGEREGERERADQVREEGSGSQ